MYVHICLYVCIYSYVYICAYCLYLAVRAANGSKGQQTTAKSLRVTVHPVLVKFDALFISVHML